MNLKEKRKLTEWNQRFYWNKKNDLFYIPSSTIEEFLRELGDDITVRIVMDDFQMQGMLNTDNSKQRSRTKKCAGRRCYAISYSIWKDYVKELVWNGKIN